jgi:hypothetical protein
MEYRGKQYTIVQGIRHDSWRWTVQIDERTIKSGLARTRESARTTAILEIDKALKPKKVKVKSPSSDDVS